MKMNSSRRTEIAVHVARLSERGKTSQAVGIK